MNEACRQQLLNAGGRCPFPDTDPDIWIAPDGTVGRIVVLGIDLNEDYEVYLMDFLPLVLH